MKKILTVIVAVALTANVFAKDYKHSVGMVAGLGMGAQYKTMVLDNFTIIAEFGYFMNLKGGTSATTMISSYQGPIANGVFAYQANITEGEGIKLDWYAGGQVKAGYATGFGSAAGIIGVGAAAGIEANMVNAPIAFSFDFRPGYAGVLANAVGAGTMSFHMFDYSFNLGVRYTF